MQVALRAGVHRLLLVIAKASHRIMIGTVWRITVRLVRAYLQLPIAVGRCALKATFVGDLLRKKRQLDAKQRLGNEPFLCLADQT